MATENPVFQILVTSGNQAILAAGSRPDALAVGQLGFFNVHTGLSVDGSAPKDAQDIYLAVGSDPTGTGALSDINKSAGQAIQVKRAKTLDVKGYTTSLPKIVEFGGFRASCNTDYSLKVEFRNQQIYGIAGYNQFTETYDYTTACCGGTIDSDCEGCYNGDTVGLAVGLMTSINADPNGLITATLFANKIGVTIGAAAAASGNITYTIGTENFVTAVVSGDSATVVASKIAATINTTTTSGYTANYAAAVLSFYPKASISNPTATTALTSAGGTSVTFTAITSANVNVTDTTTFSATYPGAGLGIRITTSNGVNTAFNGHIPIKYYNAKETDIIVSTGGTFSCNGVATVIQSLQYEDGNGINLAYDEYMAGGFNGKPGPYRVSSITGLEKNGYQSNINTASNYNQIVLEYDMMSVGGWEEYLNNLRTIIAVPCADGTTLTGFFAISDLIFTQFQAKTNDVATMDCTNTSTDVINDVTKDGISSLT